MTGLRFTVTRRGREAIVNAESNGTAPVLAHSLGLTDQVFEADPEMQALPGEHTRLTSIKGGATSPDTIHVTARDDTDATYAVRGLGLYLDDGTLFAVYGQQPVLAEKSSQAVLLLAADLQFADIAATDITFGDTNFDLNVGTEETPGVLELATPTETIAGDDDERAVHAKGLRALLDHRLGEDAPTEFAMRLIAAATRQAVRELLELKGAALKDDGAGNGLDADTLDGKHGEHYLDWDNLTGKPVSMLTPGQVITFAGTTAPTGTLLCDGSEVLRSAYPQLFDAIGTAYGVPSDPTVFKLPKVDEDSGIIHTSDPNKVGQTSDGEVIQHSHAAHSAGAGSHAHSASSDAAGDHTHGAWTDGQGQHNHGVNDPGHSHTWIGPNAGPGSGGWSAAGITRPSIVGTSHNTTGIWLNDGGHHAHNIGMNGAGYHSHGVSVAGVGDHTHAITVDATGAARNLAAGIRMLYCIAY